MQLSSCSHTPPNGKLVRLFLFILLLAGMLCCQYAEAQCLAAPATLSCNPPGATALVTDDVIGAGQVKTVNSNAALGNLNVNGGLLVVCGSATFTGISFSSGTVVVNMGGSVYINTSSSTVFGTNSYIFNYGVFTITGSIVTGQNNIIMNCNNGAVFNVLYNQLVIQGPNTRIVNYGTINSSYVIITSSNSPSVICSDASTSINCSMIINQFANSFVSPLPTSCVNISSQIINSQPMTTSTNVLICYQAGNVNISGSPNFGGAVVSTSCTSCLIGLPLRLTSFTGNCAGNAIQLTWSSVNQKENDHFLVERTTDGINYSVIGSVKTSTNEESYQTTYAFSDNNNTADEIIYYRLVNIERSGHADLSPVIAVSCKIPEIVSLFPQIIDDGTFTILSGSGLQTVTLTDMHGKTVFSQAANNEKVKTVVLDKQLEAGVYIATIWSASGLPCRKKVTVN